MNCGHETLNIKLPKRQRRFAMNSFNAFGNDFNLKESLYSHNSQVRTYGVVRIVSNRTSVVDSAKLCRLPNTFIMSISINQCVIITFHVVNTFLHHISVAQKKKQFCLPPSQSSITNNT